MCEHESYSMVGNFPEGMFVDGESLANKITCDECGEVGKEYYQFVERRWENMNND